MTGGWKRGFVPLPSFFSYSIDHLHVTRVGNESTSVVGRRNVSQGQGRVSPKRQTTFSGILMERKIGNELLTQGYYTQLKEKHRG